MIGVSGTFHIELNASVDAVKVYRRAFDWYRVLTVANAFKNIKRGSPEILQQLDGVISPSSLKS